MADKNPRVGILVLNYNQTEVTLRCLRSLHTLVQQCHIHLIDNASDNRDEFTEAFHAGGFLHLNHHHYHLHFNSNNYGYAGGLNEVLKSWRSLKYDYYWILNNDTEVDRESLSSILNEFQADFQLGIVGSHLKYANGKTQTLGMVRIDPRWASSHYIIHPEELIQKQNLYVNGASFCISQKVLDEVGLMTPDYFLYYEEVDYCFMAQSKGFHIGVALNSKVIHYEGTTTQSTGIGPHLDALMIANRQKFHRKFLKKRIHEKIALFITLLLRIKRGQWKHFHEIKRACKEDSYRLELIKKLGGKLDVPSTSD
jgi:GT2 family glycosyltransferase